MKKNSNIRFYAVLITLLLGLFDASASDVKDTYSPETCRSMFTYYQQQLTKKGIVVGEAEFLEDHPMCETIGREPASDLTCDKRVVNAINKLEAIAGNDQAVKANCKNTYNVGNCSFNYNELRVESWQYDGKYKWILTDLSVDKVFKCFF